MPRYKKGHQHAKRAAEASARATEGFKRAKESDGAASVPAGDGPSTS
jgi:hypothetical protein